MFWLAGLGWNPHVVFEDRVNTTSDGALDVIKARQAASHPNWMTAHVEQAAGCTYFPTLASPATGIRTVAVTHAKTLHNLALDDFIAWSAVAAATVRELRATFFEHQKPASYFDQSQSFSRSFHWLCDYQNYSESSSRQCT